VREREFCGLLMTFREHSRGFEEKRKKTIRSLYVIYIYIYMYVCVHAYQYMT